MKNKKNLIVILFLSFIVFTSGFYLRNIKSYADPKIQTTSTSKVGKNLTLGETIKFLESLKSVTDAESIQTPENDKALRSLKLINLAAILLMTLASVLAIFALFRLVSRDAGMKRN